MEFAFILLRIGLAFTFFWTGILILKDLKEWSKAAKGGFKEKIIPFSPEAVMTFVAIFDLIMGIWLLSGLYLWLAALLAALHLITVLIVSGLWNPAYRDVGLLAMAITLVIYDLPKEISGWLLSLW